MHDVLFLLFLLRMPLYLKDNEIGSFAYAIELLRKNVLLLLQAAVPVMNAKTDISVKRMVFNISRFYAHSALFCRPDESVKNIGRPHL